MPEVSIVPKPGLTRAADERSGQKTQFALFSDSWLEVQGYIGTALALPISNGNFEEKYGKFTSSPTILGCIDAMKSVQAASTEFGDPKTLRAALIENPSLLATDQPPNEIYLHTVWLGQRVHQTAGKIVSGYESVLEGLSGLPAKEQVDNLKAYLFDQTLGPIPLSEQMSKEASLLLQKLGRFEQKMNEYNEKLRSYTAASSGMIADVNRIIGGAEAKIRDLEHDRDEAYKAWKDFTIAAITTSVGCFLIGALLAPITGGVSLAVGGIAAIATGVGLGVKAAQCRAKYNALCDEIETDQADLRKKKQLRTDLGAFDTQMKNVGPAMSAFLKSMQEVQGVWATMNADMVGLANSITPQNVGSLPFLVKAKSNLAVDTWKSIDESAKQFTVASLVDYHSLQFGDKMPEAPLQVAA